jgi:DNA polymerase
VHVGPAGKLLDRAAVYLTNAVKHFKFEERGKRRLHKKPTAPEARACQHWLEAEISAVHPQVIMRLAATPVHRSSILRGPDEEQRHIQYREFVADLKKVREVLKEIP